MKRRSKPMGTVQVLPILDYCLLLIVLTCGTAALAWVDGSARPDEREDAPSATSPEDLQERIAGLRKKISHLERTLEAKEAEAARLAAALANAEREGRDPDDVDNRRDRVRRSLESIRQRIEQLKARLEQLRQQEQTLTQEKERIGQLQKTIDEVAGQVEQRTSELERLTRENEALASDVKELEQLPMDRQTIKVDFHPRFNVEKEREPVLVILAEGKVTPMREPYYTSTTMPGLELWTRDRHAETVEQALTRGSAFLEVVEGIDRDREYVFFVVDSSSFETFRKVRESLQRRKVPFGWSPDDQTARIGFVSQASQGTTVPGTIE